MSGMPRSKITAAEMASGSLVKKFRTIFLPSSSTEKSLGSNPLTRCPESSVTLTGTITWFTFLLILNNSSCELLLVLGVTLPSGTVLTSSGCGGGVGLVASSAEDGAGFEYEGGASFPEGGCSTAGASGAGGPCDSTGGFVGNGCGGRLAEGASGMSCF